MSIFNNNELMQWRFYQLKKIILSFIAHVSYTHYHIQII